MCIARYCEFSCGHGRITPVLCELITAQSLPDKPDKSVKWGKNLPTLHKGPPLTIEIEDPEGSVCLCQQGLKMAPKPNSETGIALAVFKLQGRTDALKTSYVTDTIVDPTLKWIKDKRRGKKTIHTVDIPVSSDEKKPIPKSAFKGTEQLFVYGSVTFDCGHMRETDFQFNRDNDEEEVMELSDLQTCPKKKCRCSGIACMYDVATGDMLSIPVGERPSWDIELL